MPDIALNELAGAAGFEPANAGTKNRNQPSESCRNLLPNNGLASPAICARIIMTQIGTQKIEKASGHGSKLIMSCGGVLVESGPSASGERRATTDVR
jgi:hypothetical protein